MKFQDLGLNDKLLKAIADCGYDSPTPIQEQAIPLILRGQDLVGIAQTGTGKTAGFTLPMIEILEGGRARARMPRSLILSPTRELAAQIAENFDTYGKYGKLSKALLVGGTSMEDQIRILERGVDVLIATPGRLLDLFGRGRILLNDIKILVIDEADRMLDMGFIPDIEKIVSLLSPMRQTLLFSATMPDEIKKLSQKFLSNPKHISVAPSTRTADRVKQFFIPVKKPKKRETLGQLIKKEPVEGAYIFCNRKRDVGGLAKWLREQGYSIRELHGDMSQSERDKALQQFKDEDDALLVCSDVAARGIDVDDVSHVFNYDVPMNADDYVHRIGRTGRAGREGCAITLVMDDEIKYFEAIEQHVGKKLEKITISPEREKASKEDQKGAKSVQKKPQKSKSKKDRVDNNNVLGFGEDMPAFFSS